MRLLMKIIADERAIRMDEKKCQECGVEDGCTYQEYYGGKVRVKIVDSKYGMLCERHAKNAYIRAVTSNKRKRKQIEVRTVHGQQRMFGDDEF